MLSPIGGLKDVATFKSIFKFSRAECLITVLLWDWMIIIVPFGEFPPYLAASFHVSRVFSDRSLSFKKAVTIWDL